MPYEPAPISPFKILGTHKRERVMMEMYCDDYLASKKKVFDKTFLQGDCTSCFKAENVGCMHKR